MPCPLFEPVRAISHPQRSNARLPLIEEHDGVCHAASYPFAVPSDLRFRCCNHGYSANACQHLPAEEKRSALRYSVVTHTGDVLEVICVEEKDYAPVKWVRMQYVITTGLLEPRIEDACMKAQALAFCQSYLRRFSF